MAYLGSKVVLAVAISAAIHTSAFAQSYHLDSSVQTESVALGSGITQLTGATRYGVSLGQTNQLAVAAQIGSLAEANGLVVAMGADSALGLNSSVAGQKGVTVSGGGGVITVNSAADIQGGDESGQWGLSANNFDLIMNGGRIVGNVQGIDVFEVLAGSNDATITSANLGANHLHVKTGTLAFQRQGTNLSGDLTVDAGAALGLQINQSTDLKHALLYVGGEAVFAAGSIINLSTPSSQFVTEDTVYTLVKADELVDNGVVINAGLNPLLQLKDVHVFDDSSLLATIGLVGANTPDAEQELNDLAQRLQQLGASQNGIQAAQSFVSVLSLLGNNNALYQRFLDAEGGDLNALLEQLTPAANGAVFNAAMSASGLTGSALSARASAVGANSGEMLKETGAWVQLLNGDANQARRNGVAGYDADSKGIVIGADGKVNQALTLGLALSLVDTDVSGAAGAKTEVSTQLLSAYARWEEGAWGLTGSVSYGQSQNDSKRSIAHEVAKASYDSDLLAAELELGYRMTVGAAVLEPVTSLRYSNVAVDAYQEKGSSAALGAGSQRFEVLDLGVGLNLSADMGEWTPSARLMAYYDFAQDTVRSTSSFILGGNSFVTTGADATKWTYEAGMGLDWSRGQYTVGLGYDYIRKADFNADTLSLKARYDF